MFAARADQENLAYAHQAAAAAKPLNQQAKTPANKAPKTPFRRNQNDENDSFQSGFKTSKKTTQKANLDPNAFITPAGPRNRAPLGMKTTNAKAKTPAPLTIKASAQKTLSPRLRRQKVKIHQAEPIQQAQDDGVPDIEYMPPRSIRQCFLGSFSASPTDLSQPCLTIQTQFMNGITQFSPPNMLPLAFGAPLKMLLMSTACVQLNARTAS